MVRGIEVEALTGGHVGTRSRRDGLLQLFVPVYFEDGDMIPVYLKEVAGETGEDANLVLTDLGSTVMHMSYEYEIDTEKKRSVFHTVALENGLEERDGRLELLTTKDRLFEDAVHFASTAAKIATMRYFSRAVVHNLFFEMVDEFVSSRLAEFEPRKDVVPIPGREELTVDYVFQAMGRVPVYLFPVNSDASSRLAAIKLLSIKSTDVVFRGFVVHEDLTKLSKRDQKLITNAADKQFYDYEAFARDAIDVFNRERRLTRAQA